MKVKPKQKVNIKTPSIKPLHNYHAYIVILALCFALYANTVPFGYVLDDTIAVTGNQYTKMGFDGIGKLFNTDFFTGFYGENSNMVKGGRYRPLSLISFAIEYHIFGENPHISHLVNILLYALTGMLIYYLFTYLFALKTRQQISSDKWYYSVPFIGALLFIVHPLHVEAVANIKGRDEILALLGSLAALYSAVRYVETKQFKYFIYTSVAFFIGLFSKENAVTFFAVIPLTVFFFSSKLVKECLVTYIPMFFIFVVFLSLRQKTISNESLGLENDLMNSPFVEMNFFQHTATLIYTWFLYVKLLFVPHPLTHDYYPYHIPIINIWDMRAIVSILMLAVLAFVTVKSFKSKNIVSYSILYFAITFSVVSNLIFPVGTFMNERFMYMPSVTFCILLPLLVKEGIHRYVKTESNYIFICIFAVTAILFSIKTVTRNTVWETNFKLFSTDVHVSENSSKAQSNAGEFYMYEANKQTDTAIRNQYFRNSIYHLTRSVEIYPKNVVALFNLASAHFNYNRNYGEFFNVYKKLTDINPDGERIFTGVQQVIQSIPDSNEYKLQVYKRFYDINPNRSDLNTYIGNHLIKMKRNDAALPYFEKAVALNPNNFEALVNVGYCYSLKNEWKRALDVFLKAEKIKPSDANNLKNIGIARQNIKY